MVLQGVGRPQVEDGNRGGLNDVHHFLSGNHERNREADAQVSGGDLGPGLVLSEKPPCGLVHHSFGETQHVLELPAAKVILQKARKRCESKASGSEATGGSDLSGRTQYRQGICVGCGQKISSHRIITVSMMKRTWRMNTGIARGSMWLVPKMVPFRSTT